MPYLWWSLHGRCGMQGVVGIWRHRPHWRNRRLHVLRTPVRGSILSMLWWCIGSRWADGHLDTEFRRPVRKRAQDAERTLSRCLPVTVQHRGKG